MPVLFTYVTPYQNLEDLLVKITCLGDKCLKYKRWKYTSKTCLF